MAGLGVLALLVIIIAGVVLWSHINEGKKISQQRSELVECRNCGKRFSRGKFQAGRGCPSCGADYLDG